MTVGCVEVPLEEATQLGVMAVNKNYEWSASRRKPRSPSPSRDSPGTALGSMGIYVFDAEFLYEPADRRCDGSELEPRLRPRPHSRSW
jgi:glucose-1-phosphate adenylyltransferase